jgi:peptidoglycan/LPS O-acetylase OafA/YrhL
MHTINLPFHYIRASAIILVFLFHTTFQLFSGGYVGVDMFFLLSGYLIAEKITQINSKPELKKFYGRRIKKIFPPLIIAIPLTVILLTLVGGTKNIITYVLHGLLSILGISNFDYMLNATTAHYTYSPFLHLWSLAIEIQFYLFAPLIYLMFKRKITLKHLTIITVISFLTYLTLLTVNPTFAYYFSGARVWEFTLGAIIFLLPTNIIAKQHTRWLTILAVASIIIYFAAYSFITPQITIFTLVPILATALIMFLHKTVPHMSLDSAPLQHKPAVFMGNISYTLYLIHYPIFFIAFNYYPELIWLAAIVSIISAWLLHVIIENKIAYRN